MQVFTFPVTSQEIRVSGTYDNPWFCLTDVCIVLGLSNPSDLAQKQLKQDGLDKIEVIDSMGRKQLVWFVNEANLYRCVMRSNKPNAVEFQDWLVENVLPSIRKTGSFGDTPNHESGGSEFLQVINGAIACGIEPERMVDLYHRFNGNKQSKDKATKPVSKQNTKPSKKALKPATDKTLARRIIKAASSLQNPTATQILEACDIPLNKTNQMKVVSVLKEFGWNNTRRRINGENLRIWQPN